MTRRRKEPVHPSIALYDELDAAASSAVLSSGERCIAARARDALVAEWQRVGTHHLLDVLASRLRTIQQRREWWRTHGTGPV